MKKCLSAVLLLIVFCVPSWAALSDNLISYWALDEASGTRADKVVASANTLSDNNTVTGNPGKVYATSSQFTAATTEYLSHTDNASLSVGGTNFTFAAWVYMDTGSTTQVIFGKDDGTTNREYLGLITSANKFQMDTWTGSGGAGLVVKATTTVLSLSTWYFVMAKYDGTTLYVSANDASPDTIADSGAGWDSGASFAIGANVTPAFPFNGRIGPVMFWKRALSAAEITQVYNNGAGLTYEGILGTGIIMHPLTSGSDTTGTSGGTVFTTSSVSVDPNSLIILAYHNARDAGLSGTISVSGLGGTWVEIDHSSYPIATPTRRMTLYRTMIGTTQTGTITITHGAAQDGAAWSLIEFTGVNTSGTSGSGAIVYEAGASGGSGSTTLSCSLQNPFADPTNNVAFGGFSRSGTSGFTPGTGFIEIHDATFTTPSNGIQTEWRIGQDTSVDTTWSGGTDCGCMAAEIKALTAAGTNPFVLLEDDDE